MKNPILALALGCSLLAANAMTASIAHAQDDRELSSGGVAPPPAIESEPEQFAPTPTERELERADREDAGRGLSFFWINGEVGYELIGLHTFSGSDLVDGDLVSATQNGLAIGAGLGVRLIFLTLGGRFRLGTFQDWQLWTLNAEVGFRVPLGRLEPYFTAGGGYASLGGFDERRIDGALGGGRANDLDVDGFNARIGAGLDYFVGRSLSVGANLTGEMLFLSRSRIGGITAGAMSDAEAAAKYGRDESSIGGGLTLSAVVGLHL